MVLEKTVPLLNLSFFVNKREIIIVISSELKVTQSCLTFCDPMTVACHTPLSMEFSRQEYGVGFLLQGIFPTPGIKFKSPSLQADSLPSDNRADSNSISNGGVGG